MQPINIQPVLINRERVQEMLGGISRTTFYRKRKQWEQTGTPFPKEVTELHPPKGGALFRYVEVIQFCKDRGLIADAQSSRPCTRFCVNAFSQK